jgi:hypothetical protein
MTLRPSYTRFYASKWRSGTLMLTLEEEGLYIRISAFQMECGQPVPLDWKDGARLLCVQPLKYRKTVDSLIAKGKIIKTESGLICERAMAEFTLASRSVETDKSDPPTNPDTYPHTNPATYWGSMGVEAKKDHSFQGQNRKRREEKKERTKQAAAPTLEPAREASGAALPKLNLDDLSDRLTAACNGALDNPVNCLGLLNLATPQMWISQGCDLELDVIPTLQAAGKKYHGKRIRDWNYFTGMIAEAKAKRTAGLPSVATSEPKKKSSYEVMRAALAINAQAQGVTS